MVFSKQFISNPAIELYDYQKKWINDNSPFKIGMFARQTGKTFTTTLEIVNDCLSAEAKGQKKRWIILSSGERQALEAIETGVKRHCEAFQHSLQDLYNTTKNICFYKFSRFEVTFLGGSKITAIPANPDTARGFSANLFLDEFAFHIDSHKLWSALFPVISAGHKIRIASTPNGQHNKFYELMTDSTLEAIWSRHTVDIYQAVEQGLQRDISLIRKALHDETAWKQEYELAWLDEESSWLSYELIESVEHTAAGHKEFYEGKSCYAGVDIATRLDSFVIWVVESVNNILWTREVIAETNISFADQDRLLAQIFERYQIRRCCMDQSGIGEKPVEDAKRKYGKTRIEGIIFTSANKHRLATIGKQTFESKSIRIPANDHALRNELNKIQKTVGPTGMPKFVASRTKEGHADKAWACFLACQAAQQSSLTSIISSQRRHSLIKGY